MFTRDGGVIPSHIPVMSEDMMGRERTSMFGVYRGYVQKPVFSDDPENTSGELEYVVNIEGHDFLGVLDGQKKAGGIFSNHTRVRTGVEAVDPADISLAKSADAVPNDLKDGEAVWVLFTKGQLDFPVIIGSAENSRIGDNPDYVKPVTADGKFERYEFNGLEFKIDKESNLSITHLGRKKHVGGLEPTIENEDAVESKIEFKGNGDFFVDIDDANLKLSLLKADKKAEFSLGDGLRIVWDGTNDLWTLVTNAGTKIGLLGGADDKVEIEAATGAKVAFDGPADKFSWVGAGGTKIEGDGAADKITAQANFGDVLSVSKDDGIQASTPSGTSLSMKSGVVTADGTGGKLKLEGGKVAMGASGFNELMQQLENLINCIEGIVGGAPTALQPPGAPMTPAVGLLTEFHLGNLGYPTGIPENPALLNYTNVVTNLATIKATITALKGTL